MYVVHPFLQQPADDARLWRYTTPTGFLALLVSRSIFFSRLSNFEDPFEGVPPRAVIAAMRRQNGAPGESSDGLATWKRMIELVRTTVCANCWHVSDVESEAMWKLYGRYEDGLAFVATPASIRAAFRDQDITGGLVDYSGNDFEAGTAEQNLLQWATTKRPSYQHESEFRLLARRADDRAERGGISVPIDPEVLIDEVVLSPRMQRWQIDMFRELLATLQFGRPVRESSLLTPPW